MAEAELHDRVGEQHRLLLAGVAIDDVDDVADLLLGQDPVDGLERHLVALRQSLAEQHAARGRLEALHVGVALLVRLRDAADDLRVKRDRAGGERLVDLGHVAEHHALARLILLLEAEVVEAEDHVLRRNDDRLAVGGRQDVVGATSSGRALPAGPRGSAGRARPSGRRRSRR